MPLVVFLLYIISPKTNDSDPSPPVLKAGEVEEKGKTGVDCYKQGWIIVTQTYIESPDEISLSTQTLNESETKSAYSSLYKLVQKDSHVSKETENITTNGSAEASGISLDQLNGTSTSTPSNQTGSSTSKKHRYYAVLKHGNLFLYKDETLKNVKHVIVLAHHIVSIWPLQLTEAQLFTKYAAIAIINATDLNADNLAQVDTATKGTFFIYTDLAIEKEDWWFALIRVTKQKNDIDPSLDPNVHAKTLHFTTKHMVELIQNLYSSEGQLQTKWLNGILGRIFLGLQHTEGLKTYLHAKLTKKLNKIKRPGFLDAFQITHIYPGDSAPYFTYPSLKEISPDGTIIVSSYVSYHGNISVHIATKVNLNLGMRFSAREVDVVLKLTLQKFQGPMLFKIKPPPSERIWYTYEVEPIMELKIEPIISARQMNYNIITNSIHKKFQEGIKESLVLPHWDDITFHDSTGEIYRGGIWDHRRPDTEVEVKDDLSQNISETAGIDTKSISQSSMEKEGVDIEDAISLDSSAKAKLAALSHRIKSVKSLSNKDFISGDIDDDTSQNSAKNATINTLKKIGKWYFKDGNSPHQEYTPPEMILNRRARRESNSSDSENTHSRLLRLKPSWNFGRFNDNSSVKSEDCNMSYSSSFEAASLDNVHQSHSVNLFADDEIDTILSTGAGNTSPTIPEEFDTTLTDTLTAEQPPSPVTLPRSNTTRLHRKPPPPEIEN